MLGGSTHGGDGPQLNHIYIYTYLRKERTKASKSARIYLVCAQPSRTRSILLMMATEKNHLVISSDPHHDYLLTCPMIPTNCPGEGARN